MVHRQYDRAVAGYPLHVGDGDFSQKNLEGNCSQWANEVVQHVGSEAKLDVDAQRYAILV